MGIVAREGHFFGEVIREIRTARGYSIEELARGINWSPSMIQKVETNKTVPTPALVYDILTFLDIDGLTYEDFFIDASYFQHMLREALCIELEKRNTDRAFVYLDHYRRLLDSYDGDESQITSVYRRQFYRLAEMIALAEQYDGCFWRPADWMSLIHLTLPDYRNGDRIKELNLTKSEKMIINGMALTLISEKEYTSAERLLYALLSDINDRMVRGRFFNRQMAVLCNNIILLRIAKDEWQEGLPLLSMAFDAYKITGGSYGYLNIAKLAVKVYAHLYGEREAESLFHEVRSCFGLAMHFCNPDDVDLSFEKFWNEPSEMYVL